MEIDLEEMTQPLGEVYAAERAVRDAYAARLSEFRPHERLWKTEHIYPPSLLRGDMRTVDRSNRIRIWEFKIKAGFEGLGQILTYVALARRELNFARPVLGVLAAFEFPDESLTAIEVLNLGIEAVVLPEQLRLAGAVPAVVTSIPVPRIPVLPSAPATAGIADSSREDCR